MKPSKLTIVAPPCCFPSDNVLDAMNRRDRIAIKNKLKQDAQILTLEWLGKNKISKAHLSKEKPLFVNPVRLTLTVYLIRNKRLDVHNLSIKHFLDQLVSMHILADDSVKEIPEVIARFGGYVNKSFTEFELEEIEI
jgi:hypothetical protein